MKRVAIILAAGVSSRMNTAVPKVLHEVCGRAMLAYVLDACRQVGVDRMYVVVGYGGEQVQERFADAGDIVWVNQAEQLGTAHAVLCCKDQLKDFDGQALILCGDGPLIRPQVLQSLIDTYESGGFAAVLATAVLDDPTGYGRIIRDARGNIEAIVEHNDCSEQQRQVKEVNPSYYLFNNKVLFEALAEVKADNVKGEYYLTDALAIILANGHTISVVTAVRPEEAISVNDRRQLSAVAQVMQGRIQEQLMDSGVTIVDPAKTWIDVRARIGSDTIIEPFTCIQGDVKIGKGCRIGPFAFLGDGTVLEDNAVVKPSGVVSNGDDAAVRLNC
jgi:bifunctional UDP-N-acetylglucosamine pyrophosphorylase/glucosamine-1-phosphate N-acetyltransferase